MFTYTAALLAAAVAASTYSGAGTPINNPETGEQLETTSLYYNFNQEENSEFLNVTNETSMTAVSGDRPDGSITKARSCVQMSSTDPKYLCFNYELYVTTFFLKVTSETNIPDGESAYPAATFGDGAP